MDASPIRYAPSPGGRIAYRTVGEGPLDLVVYPAGAWNIDIALDDPRVARWLRQLSAFARVIIWHSRGLAMSDPLPVDITIEDWSRDLIYVLDAAECERASYVWYRDVATIGMVAAATRPDRCASMVLVDGYARRTKADDYPFGPAPDELRELDAWVLERVNRRRTHGDV